MCARNPPQNSPSRPDDPSAAPRAAAAALGPSLMDRSAPNGAQGRGQGQGTEQGTAAAAAQSRRASGPPLRPESSLAYEQEPAWMAVAPARPPTADQNSGPIREPPQPPPRSSIANMHEGAGGRATGREYEDEAEDSEWDQDGGVTLDMDVTMMEQDDEVGGRGWSPLRLSHLSLHILPSLHAQINTATSLKPFVHAFATISFVNPYVSRSRNIAATSRRLTRPPKRTPPRMSGRRPCGNERTPAPPAP